MRSKVFFDTCLCEPRVICGICGIWYVVRMRGVCRVCDMVLDVVCGVRHVWFVVFGGVMCVVSGKRCNM